MTRSDKRPHPNSDTKSLSKSSPLPLFSHIYLEKDAQEDPITQKILKRFPRSKIIPIDDYKQVFNRSQQDWRAQKRSPKLILAHKKDHLVYPCSDIAPSFGFERFYYNTLVMNCIYDCRYCYLQGMYPTANVVVFTNLQEYFESTTQTLAQSPDPLYLCLSYDTDLLAFENWLGYTSQWVEYTRQEEKLWVEIRTKSINHKPLLKLEPCSRTILAWTLSPQPIIDHFEPKTPPLLQRIRSAQTMIEKGWPVRLCLDPILAVENWREVYLKMCQQIEQEIDLSQIHSLCTGVFRMGNDYFKRMRSRDQTNPLLHYPYHKNEQKISTYPPELEEELTDLIEDYFAPLIAPKKVVIT